MNTSLTAKAACAPAGHAHHFLTRLDRVTRADVELALMLYRDEDLVRFILDRAHLPEGAARVAFALGDATRGPFLVVTREGRFVTCLGEGMRARRLIVITRTQLDGHLARAREVRARNEALAELGRRTDQIYRRVLLAGGDLPREEVVAASALAPPIRTFLAAMMARVSGILMEGRPVLARILRRTDNPRPTTHPALHAHWNLSFAVGHLAALASCDGPGLVEALPELASPACPLVSLLALDTGIVSTALKGLWAAGKLGREVLPAYKRILVESDNPLQITDAILAMTVLGLRHARLRAEVYKAISSPRARAGQPDHVRELDAALTGLARSTLDVPDHSLAVHRAFGARRVVRLTAHLPANSPWHFARPEDVPEDLAFTAGAAALQDLRADPRHVAGMFHLLPWLAHAQLADLYLPADFIRATRTPWRPIDTIALLRPHCVTPPTPRPDLARSAPCPCGSAKKYKRCCGEERHPTLPQAA
jgi:hypothetical protein